MNSGVGHAVNLPPPAENSSFPGEKSRGRKSVRLWKLAGQISSCWWTKSWVSINLVKHLCWSQKVLKLSLNRTEPISVLVQHRSTFWMLLLLNIQHSIILISTMIVYWCTTSVKPRIVSVVLRSFDNVYSFTSRSGQSQNATKFPDFFV